MRDRVSIATAGVAPASPYANVTTPGRVEAYGKKLMRYLSGGGLEAFTRTPEEERVETKQERFILVAAIVGVAWLVFWIV